MQNLIPCRFHIEVESVLKTEGLRATKQRLDIWDELSGTNKHRDIETILHSLKKKKINVSRATLYRTIDVFVKHGLLKKLTLDVVDILFSLFFLMTKMQIGIKKIVNTRIEARRSIKKGFCSPYILFRNE